MSFVIAVLIVIGIPMFFICKWVDKDMEKNKKLKEEEYRKEGIEHVGLYSFKCLGGFKDIGACKSCYIDLFKDRLRMKLYKEDDHGKFLGSKEAEVMLSNIIDITLENESQIIERVSLGKMVVFGLLSFGMKGKQAEIQREVLVLTFNYENEVVNLVLDENKGGYSTIFDFMQKVNSLRKIEETI